jgi:RNA 3'-terminal phosphate cyclase (ATP)
VQDIDGGVHSGSGTLLRYAAAIATILGEPLHIFRIRARREKAGLRPQHLQALRACCELSSGQLDGDVVGSQEIVYKPGPSISGGIHHWDIGTAGSATMLAFCVLPIGLFAPAVSRFSLAGGLFQDHSPTLYHMRHVLLPILERMGVRASVQMLRPGYVPGGRGELELQVSPSKGPLQPLDASERGKITRVRGIALASHLRAEQVSKRMADQTRALLRQKGISTIIETLDDELAVQKGAALAIWAELETGMRVGFDQAGKRGRRSENIAGYVVRSLLEDLDTGATTDRFLADQLILFAALAAGRTEYVIPRMTDHVASNLWLVEKMLGAKSKLEGNLLRIDGIGYHRQ